MIISFVSVVPRIWVSTSSYMANAALIPIAIQLQSDFDIRPYAFVWNCDTVLSWL
ncbi:hypothetical protein KP509_33G000500 [Ceratopteris richardii]|uniref:Uncharacterized protein n=1 Tax=Ceratopteris richardii TaxID=49495 RepID=A0A8T2QMJ6_CERRI|nr:hypothetical protein KP509_33G000500 [Ceratopteris richardii]